MPMNRREFVKELGAGAAVAALGMLSGCATPSAPSQGRVVVIGGGFGGATAAKYVRMWAPALEVVLIERDTAFVSCPVSNRVLGGGVTLEDLTLGYDKLRQNHGVRVIRDEAVAVDPVRREVRLATEGSLTYDRLIVAPGIDFMYETIPGLSDPAAREKVPHAWKAGAQTLALRKRLESMRDGGVVVVHVPRSPYRCPPGPYERACQIALFLKNNKPRSKLILLDANEDIQSKKGLFTAAWNDLYQGQIEYRPNSELRDVDAKTLTVKLDFDDVKADVLNVIPPQRAGTIARQAGLINVNNRWCGIDYLTFESTVHKNIHVIGDAILAAPAMPKSGHMANQHAKIAADAVVALLSGRAVNDEPMIANTCYSWISNSEVVHIASVHKFDAEKKTLVPVPGSSGVSAAVTSNETRFALAWAENIWADALA